MGIFSTIAARKTEKRSSSPIPDFLLNVSTSSSGVSVNDMSALQLTALWSIVQRLSTTIGIFPLRILENIAGGKEERNDHYAYRLLNIQPNEYQTAFEFRQILMSNQLIYGAGIAEIIYNNKGFPTALYPIDTNKVKPVNKNGKLTYKVERDSGSPSILQPHQLLIFKLFPTLDGSWLNPISIMREVLGDAIAVNRYSSLIFQNGVSPSGIVTGVREDLTEEAHNTLVERFKSYTGLGKSHSLMLLEGAEKFERISMSPEEAHLVEVKRFNIAEICRIYGVPAHMVFEVEQSSWGTGLSEMSQSFMDFVMLPHLRRWEQELSKKLVSVDNPSLYCKFVVEGAMRGNTKERLESYRQGAQIGLYTVDDLLKMEDRNPVGGAEGNVRLVPANMQPLSKAVNYKQGEVK